MIYPLKMGPIRCPETSARHNHCLLHNNPEERSSRLLRDGSQMSRVEEEGYGAGSTQVQNKQSLEICCLSFLTPLLGSCFVHATN